MKIVALLLLAGLLACTSSEKKEISGADSTAVALADTADVTNLPGENESAIGEGSTEDYAEGDDPLENEYNKWNSEIESGAFHRVNVNSSGYESQGDVTWLFDAEMEPRYFKQEYAVEGMEGSTELIINNGSVVCATITEGMITRKWCAATQGWSENESGERTQLSSNFGSEQDEALKQYLKELKDVLNSLEIKSEDMGIITLERREAENYGDVNSETVVTVELPKILYDALVGN